MANSKMPTDKELRERGYMTSDEFVDRLIPGLKEYLRRNWGRGATELNHPEDLISNVSVYIEVAYHVIAEFGITEKSE